MMRVNDRHPVPRAPGSGSCSSPSALSGVARPTPPGLQRQPRMTVASDGAARLSSTCVSCRCAMRVYRAPAARRLTEGRSLPGDSTLVCAAYHQFPLILNRIQRTKPAPGHPTAAAPDVYIGIEARRIPGVPHYPDFLASISFLY